MTATMRRIGILVALVLALSTPALLSSGASAKPADKPTVQPAATKLKASAPKKTDATGAVTITGKLTSKGVAVADATVVLRFKAKGTGKYATLTTGVTDAEGAVSFPVLQTGKHVVYKLRFLATETLRASHSKARSVKLLVTS